MKVLYTILVGLFIAAGAYAQGETPPTPTTPAVEELYLARDDGKGKAGEQVSEFSTSDVPIYCVVLLEASQKVTVKMNFVAVKVAGVKPDTKVVTASYITKEGQNRVNFAGTPDGKWTPGRYRVVIFLDGKAAKDLEFDIKGGGGTGASNDAFAAEVPKPKPIKRSLKP